MDSTLPNEVRSILTGSIKASSFKSRKSYERYSKKNVDNRELGHASGFFPHNKRWKNKNKKSSNIQGVTNTATGAIVGVDTSEEKNSEQAPITITIPVTQQSTANANPPQNAPPPFHSGNRGRGRGRFFGKSGRRDYDTGMDGATPKLLVTLMLIV